MDVDRTRFFPGCWKKGLDGLSTGLPERSKHKDPASARAKWEIK